MKGIILAGGSGTRLHPITIPTVKQLLPIYDKPMIYYPLAVLMQAGIKDILIITTSKDLSRFKELLGDGSHIGVNFTYKEQENPNGIAEALIIGEEFIGEEKVCLILGDNLFFGGNLDKLLAKASKFEEGSTVFGYYVSDPNRYGVVEFDSNGKVERIAEKPKIAKSNYAITGIYFYDSEVSKIAKNLKPSDRGELEITDVNNEYIKRNKMNVVLLDQGYAWLDTGTYDSLIDAGEFVKITEKRQGIKIGCIEEIAYKKGFIDKEKLKELAANLNKTNYGEYLLKLIK